MITNGLYFGTIFSMTMSSSTSVGGVVDFPVVVSEPPLILHGFALIRPSSTAVFNIDFIRS